MGVVPAPIDVNSPAIPRNSEDACPVGAAGAYPDSVWRADDDAADPDPAATANPTDLGVAEPGVEVVHAADSNSATGCAPQPQRFGGPSPLLHFADDADAAIDVTTAHPASLPQFITGLFDVAVESVP